MIELAIYALFVAIFRAYFSIKHFLGMQKPFLNLKLHKKIYYFEIGIDVQGLYYMKKQYFLKWKKMVFFSEELMALSTNQKWKNLKLFTFSIVIYADPCPWNFIVK